jgi:hypothetical protein
MRTHIDDLGIVPRGNVPVSVIGVGIQYSALVELDINDVVAGLESNLQGP